MYVRVKDFQTEDGVDSYSTKGWQTNAQFNVTLDKPFEGTNVPPAWPIDIQTEDEDVHLAFTLIEAETLARQILEVLENDSRAIAPE